MLTFVSGIFRQPGFLKRPQTTRTVMSVAPGRSPEGMGVVITGSTKGVGRALAEKFLTMNDTVVVTSRDEAHVQDALISIRKRLPNARAYGYVADVREHADVERLLTFASETLGTVNAVICNAGTIGSRGPLTSQKPEDLKRVVDTNLLGPMFCAKEAIRISESQTRPVHVFLMDGSGTRGNSTADYAAYGATKRSIPQLVSSLNAEMKKSNGNTRFHNLSPGMVLTDLLLNGISSPRVFKIFNFLAEEPETVSEELVPQIRSVIQNDKRNTYIAFLTASKAIYRLTTGFLLGFRKNLFFDEASGRRIDAAGKYNENGVRIRD